MKKLFAAATLAGAAAAIPDAPTPVVRERVEADTHAAHDAIQAIAPAERVPVDEITIVRPLVLTTGSPACGNVLSKAGRSRCPPPITAADILVGSAMTPGAPVDDAGVATRAKPRWFQFHLLRR